MPLPVPQVIDNIDGVGRLVICKQPSLAPTLLYFAVDAEASIEFSPMTGTLFDRGWTVASIDQPGHGPDIREDESTSGLANWALRCARGEHIVQSFCSRVSALIETYLVPNNISAAGRIALAGTSRGGFMALHAAAAIGAVKASAAIIPVTDLAALSEFTQLGENWIVKATVLRYALLERKPVFLASAANDARVSAARCVLNAGEIMSRAGDERNALEIHVSSADGHSPPPGMDAKAADWLFAAVS